ncbi:MAG TPA: hypothetical protein PLQ35_12185 [bacterium]|nr:hypothetical protein [bacterium]HQL63044.1 hypothetical protein [bacterium]
MRLETFSTNDIDQAQRALLSGVPVCIVEVDSETNPHEREQIESEVHDNGKAR